MRGLSRAAAALLAAAAMLVPVGAPSRASAQDGLSMGQVRSPILTIDVDRMLAETRLGRRVADDLRTRAEALAAENERLRAELTQEERSLTERRPTMEMEAFRAEAEAFDQRAQRTRAEQDAKQQDLEAAVGQGREAFLTAVTPVLGRLMMDSGAAVILERRDVFLSAGLVDVTDEAVAAIDAELGDGRSPTDPVETEPEESPDPASRPAPKADEPDPPIGTGGEDAMSQTPPTQADTPPAAVQDELAPNATATETAPVDGG